MTDDNDFHFTMTQAKMEQVPPLICLWGLSGSGKTLSALYLARGIVGPEGVIALIDTENGRAKFYASEVSGWKHIDMQPPFTPQKYSAAFKFCEDNGADIIIVDSQSHVWEGEGGVMDQADKSDLKGLAKWNAPKMAHKRMMNNLMRSTLPVIFCGRAKEKMVQTGTGRDMKITSAGYQVIAEKNFIYEMTVSLHMSEDGKYNVATSKIPKAMRGVFVEGAQINPEMGQKLASWLAGGEALDKETMKLRRDGADAATRGVKAYVAWKDALTAQQKEKIRPYHAGWSADAKAADEAEAAGFTTGNANENQYLAD